MPARAASSRPTPRATAAAVTRTRSEGFTTAPQASAEGRAGSCADRHRAGDPAVAHDHLAVGVGGDAGFVGDEDDRGPLLAGHAGHQVHDELTGQRVE